jgi:protein-S-isoprenylcysteine O-methyltransferase Ste14
LAEVPSLGERGGGWVVLQFALLIAVVGACVAGPRWPDSVAGALALVGAALALVGAALGVVTARAIGSGLTPYPRPSSGVRLVEHGPYGVVRHPFYSAAIAFLGGLSLAFSPVALGLTAALGVVWALKASVEERFLGELFPEYDAYRERTRYRLVPFVY